MRAKGRILVRVGVVLAGLVGAGLALGAQEPSSRAKARADAAHQLAELTLPSGATKVSSDPSRDSSLGPPRVAATSPRYVIDDYGYWRVPGRPSDVASQIQAHTPAGSDGTMTGSDSSCGVCEVGWPFPNSSEVVLRELEVQLAPASGGGTAVRADGVAVWVPPRPAWDQVPGSARVMSVLQWQRGRYSRPITFRDPRELQRVISLIDQAPRVPPEVMHCAKSNSEPFKLIFQSLRPGPVLARVHAVPRGCPFMVLSVGGRAGPTLTDVYQLSHLLDEMISKRQRP